MFYAALEIVIWILLAAIIGGGIGYGLSEARSVKLGRRLSDSRADAPMERELAIAWDTIEDLNRRLQVAHETIRSGTEQVPEDEDEEYGDYLVVAEPESATPITIEPTLSESHEIEADPANDAFIPPDAAADFASPLVHTVEEVTSAYEDEETGEADEEAEGDEEADDGVVGTRLSDRVASASIGNQVELIKTVKFDRPDQPNAPRSPESP